MSNKSDLRGPFDKLRGKRAKALLKCASVYFYQIQWSLQSQLSWQKSLLLTCKILGLLLNTLVAVEKYPVLNRDNLSIPIQMLFISETKHVFQIFCSIFEISLKFKHFLKKVTLIAFVFPKFRTPRLWLDKSINSPVSEDPWTSNMGDVPKHCWNLHHSIFIIFIEYCRGQLNLKKSLLFTCQILGLLLNTLAADEKYPVLNRDNLTIPIHIQLSQKRITFSQFLAPILKSSLNFKHLEKQMTLTAFVFTKLQTPKTYSDKCL